MPESLLVRYMQPLLAGRRSECAAVIDEAARHGVSAKELICDIIWPAMLQVERLYRDDRINIASEHIAGRINRAVVNRLQAHLPQEPRLGRRVLVTSAEAAAEELGAEIVSDLLQADGWEVYFLGGGVPHDEILSLTGQLRPQVLLIFGTKPEDVPQVRKLVELIREIGVCPTMNIVVTGGIYGRADGLWQEVGADRFAPSLQQVCGLLRDLPPRNPLVTARLGVVKKRHRRRKSSGKPVLVGV
jgi:methanogenic corrinoid protein MtbC1